MKKISKKISEADKNYNQSMHTLVNELLPTYEGFCLKEYLKYDSSQEVEDKLIFGKGIEDKLLIEEKSFLVKRKIFLKKNTKKNFQKRNSQANNIELIHDVIKCEIKEIEAFQEALSVRDQWEAQLNKIIQKNKDYQMTLQNLTKGSAMANLLALGNRHENIHILKQNIAKVILS